MCNMPRAVSGVVKIDPLCFLARCRKRRLNHVLSDVYRSMSVIVLLFLGPLLCILEA